VEKVETKDHQGEKPNTAPVQKKSPTKERKTGERKRIRKILKGWKPKVEKGKNIRGTNSWVGGGRGLDGEKE